MYHHEPWLEEHWIQRGHNFYAHDPIPACCDQQHWVCNRMLNNRNIYINYANNKILGQVQKLLRSGLMLLLIIHPLVKWVIEKCGGFSSL